MEEFTPFCNEIHQSLDRIEKGIGKKDYELKIAEELLLKLPEESREIYMGLIDKVKAINSQ